MEKEFSYPVGRVLLGTVDAVRSAYDRFAAQPVDEVDLCDGDTGYSPRRTTLGGSRSVTGPGTFYGRAQRTLTFCPSDDPGWWIDRTAMFGPLRVTLCCAAAIPITTCGWRNISSHCGWGWGWTIW